MWTGGSLWEKRSVFFMNDLNLKPIKTPFKWQTTNKCGIRKIENSLLSMDSVLKDRLCVSHWPISVCKAQL